MNVLKEDTKWETKTLNHQGESSPEIEMLCIAYSPHADLGSGGIT